MVWIIIAQPDMMLGYLPIYITKEFYDFEILNTGNDDSAVKAVVEGRADLSLGDPFMFNQVDYGKVKVMKGFIKRPFLWLITFNPFLKSIKNKILVTLPEPSTTYHYALKLQKEYNLKLFETPFSTELGPLLTQEADICLANEPAYTQAVMNGAITLQSFVSEKFAFTGFCSTKDQPEFFKHLKKAMDIFYKDEEKTLEIAKKYFSLNEEILKKAINNLRVAKIYDFNFTKEEIDNALTLKGLKYETFKKFINIKI
ncbi:MAG: hypothetical protein ABH828_03620 [archaeon]